ncbi:MAG: FtsX-like permease family protein, partial [Candidatus Thorarchaeota archaeon]
KSETLGVMFIAMVFTAAAFSAIAATSGINHINQLIQFQVGADIVADANTYGSNVTTDILEDIRAIDGVYDVSAVLVWGCMVYYQTIGPWSIIPNHRFVTLYGVQPTEWIDTAFFLPSFTKSYSPEKALSLLEENQNNILASFQPVIGYDIAPDSSYSYVYSDLLDVYIFGQESEDYLNLSIVDIMSSDENMNSQTFLPGFPDDEDFLIANIELLHEIIGVPLVSKLYVKLNPGVNHTRVVEEIWQSNPNSFVNIVSSQAEIDKIIGTRAGRSIYGVYTINVMFSLFYLTIGMCIVAMEKNRSFRKQFSVIRALGSQQRSVLGSMLIDSFLTMAMASIIGIFVGSLLSLLVLQTPLTYIGVSGSLDWLRLPITIVLPVETLSIILLLSFTIPLLATFVITRHSLNADLIDELRASF